MVTLLLHIGLLDEDRIAEVNSFFIERGINLLVPIDEKILPILFMGTYHVLDLDAFIAFLQTVEWAEPEALQIIFKDQTDPRFQVINIFE